jgi:hypothetical protein
MHGAQKKNERPIPVEQELEPTAFWRREFPEELRRQPSVQGLGRASRRCTKSPVPSQQGS